MVPYLLVFGLSTLCVFMEGNRQNKARVSWGILAVLILSVFAGVRDFTIGTDINFYILRDFEIAQSSHSGFWQFIKSDINGMEFLYLATQYIFAQILKCRTAHGTLFALSLIINSFVYMGIKNQRDSRYCWLAWLLYCFMLYNHTLNIMRECAAISIVFYLFSDVERLSLKRTLFFSVLAGLFHTSGFLGIVFYAFYYIIVWKVLKPLKIENIIFVILCIGMLCNAQVFAGLAYLGLLPSKYYHYIETGSTFYTIIPALKSIGIFSYFLYYILNLSKKKNKDAMDKLTLGIVILDLITSVYSNLLVERISYYFMMFEIRYVPEGVKVFTKKDNSRTFIIFAVAFCSFLYWYINIVLFGYTETYPYKLGI